jgi:hypothetical protein
MVSNGSSEKAAFVAMSAAQAYSGAICNALELWIRDFPITPDEILKAIEEKQKG